MKPLEKSLRNRLERTVKEARDVAEIAARAALGQLGVREASPFDSLTDEERALRRRLRAHGRQLGDTLDGGQTQTMERLVEEVAYQHWHRMLFAGFLAENDLLMYPDPDGPVPVTLEECEDLAADEGAVNGWELAARFAARMLPQIFRLDAPVFGLVLSPEHQHKLERLVADLPLEVFTASDSLGWVYQFWQTKRKDEVNASELKIGARELPAVTQLFTEPYMVSFLLDNALGTWWAARRLTAQDAEEVAAEYAQSAEIEDELRRRVAIPGVPLEYLRFVRGQPRMNTDEQRFANDEKIGVNPCSSLAQRWGPAAGTFDAWPERLADPKILDPCCSSGHFLVAAMLMLVPMRMELEGLSARQAVDAVLRENIHGLELDQRCVELAAFALASSAWRYPGAGGYRPLPELNLACSGLSVSLAKEEWKQLGLGVKNLSIALDWMHDIFKDVPVLGSLLDPAKTDAAKLVRWDELSSALELALQGESTSNTKNTHEQDEDFVPLMDEKREVAVVAQGLAKAATLLAGRYQWVITNVPYRPAELDPNMDLADEQREWVRRCEALASHADEDGIVCIPPVRGEASASDRLLGLLAAAYKQVTADNQGGAGAPAPGNPQPAPSFSAWTSQLLAAADHGGKSLETWLREKFFTQHCKLFQHRPFLSVPDVGKKGAGVLRDKPNINWNKDRGKDVESAPWYHLFNGDRINDHHLTLSEKRAARDQP